MKEYLDGAAAQSGNGAFQATVLVGGDDALQPSAILALNYGGTG
jgi:hypothetical protein